MKIKTSKLTGAALDWAVAKCEGLNPNTDPEMRRQYVGYPGFAEANGFGYAIRRYSTDWEHGGPIIERELISVHPMHPKPAWATIETWSAATVGRDINPMHYAHAPLVAAMRCYVASKFGTEIEIPEELL